MKHKRGHPCYKNKNFNPLLGSVLASNKKYKVAVIHVGKCAGESTLLSIKQNLPSNDFDIFEYHCFDANELLVELLRQQHALESVYFVICTRDPLERWVSSFNWDLHNMFLSKSMHSKLHEKYFTVIKLVEELCKENPDEDALTLSRFGHMGMGISWYLPGQVFGELPSGRTYTIRTESIERDLHAVIQKLRALTIVDTYEAIMNTPKTKDDYKSKYPAGTFGNLNEATCAQIEKMKRSLESDYAIHELAMKFIP